MRKRALKEIMEMAEHQDSCSIEGIMADFYQIPVSRLYKSDYRASSEQPKNILSDLKIPGSCDDILNLGEIAYLIKDYRRKRTDGISTNVVLLRLAQLGYWY